MKLLKIFTLMIVGFCALASCSDNDGDGDAERQPSPAERLAGTYKGVNNVVVAGQTYVADIEYKILANADSTISVVVPEYSLQNTIMGNLTLGAYTISNIPYNASQKTFSKVYGSDGLSQQFKAVKVVNGVEQTTMDAVYSFDASSSVTVQRSGSIGLTVGNSFKLGKMPFDIVANFISAVQ